MRGSRPSWPARGAAWALGSLLSGLAASLYLELRATSALSLVLVAGAARIHAAVPVQVARGEGIAATVFGAIFALFAVAGRMSERGNWIGYLAHRSALPEWLQVVVYSGVFLGLAVLFRSALLAARRPLASLHIREVAPSRWSERDVRNYAWGAILACWMPYVLCLWPGVVTPDSRSQILQGLGSMPWNDHHPIGHTLAIAAFLGLGKAVFGSVEGGIALYSISQALLLSGTFAWIAGRLHREGVRSSVVSSSIAMAALLPLHAVYSVTMWKNIPYACAIVGESFALWDLSRKRGSEDRRGALARFGLFGVLSVLLQSNGLAAFLLPAVVAIACSDARERRLALATVLAPVAAYLLVRGGSRVAGVRESRDLALAGLSIPVQQVARALVDGAVPSREQAAMIEEIGPTSEIVRNYDRHSVDRLKTVVNGSRVELVRSSPARFASLWLSLGLENPRSYLAAWRDQTCGYWFPDVPYSNVWQNFEGEGLGASRRSVIGDAPCRLVRGFAAYSENLPLLGALRSIGLWVWIALFMAAHALASGRPEVLACFAPVVGTWASLLLATPIHAEVRYAYAFYLLAPLLFVAPLLDGDPEEGGA